MQLIKRKNKVFKGTLNNFNNQVFLAGSHNPVLRKTWNLVPFGILGSNPSSAVQFFHSTGLFTLRSQSQWLFGGQFTEILWLSNPSSAVQFFHITGLFTLLSQSQWLFGGQFTEILWLSNPSSAVNSFTQLVFSHCTVKVNDFSVVSSQEVSDFQIPVLPFNSFTRLI